jgi:hypothetical protein
MSENQTPFSSGSLRGASRGAVVDHRLARRSLIIEFKKGRLRRDQVCDAHPELMRAARNFGEETKISCPICEQDKLVLVTYVFGPRLPAHGRVLSKPKEAVPFTRGNDQYTAYVVEACRTCAWHHLLRVLPIGGRRRKAG